MTRYQPIWACVAVLVVVGSTANAAELQVGTAVVDITPPVPYRMSGYFRERLSTGVKDPLLAKALVFRQGDHSAALVVCDLIGIAREVSQAARERASNRTGIPAQNIAITATHSHTGPLYSGAMRKHFHEQAVAQHGKDPYETIDYSAQLTEKLVEVIAAADKAAQPSQIAHGVAQERRLSFNRRFHMKDGTVRFNPGQQNPDIVRVAGPIDPDVGMVRFSMSSGGKPLAVLSVFALHLDTLGGTEYSADYPRYVSQELQAAVGKDVVSMFGAGTCGDINHIDVTIKGRRSTEEIGRMLGQTIKDHLDKLQPAAPALAVRRAIVPAALQKYSPEQVAAAQKNLAKIGGQELSFLEQVEAYKIAALQLLPDPLPLEVQVFRLSSDAAIVTLPGEVFVDLGLAIKAASPFKTTLVVELANDAPGYIPTRKAFAEGSYETVNSRVQPGGGEAMAEAAIKLLKELELGRN
jgi:hypothetical protein